MLLQETELLDTHSRGMSGKTGPPEEDARETWAVSDSPPERSLSEPGNKSHLVPFSPGPTCGQRLPLFAASGGPGTLARTRGDMVDKTHIWEKANGIRKQRRPSPKNIKKHVSQIDLSSAEACV